MSEFTIQVVKIGSIERLINSDHLSTTLVHGGYPVIFKTTDFKEGDLAVYIPVDSILPDRPEWEFLGNNKRIKAKRLRGTFSMGMLTQAQPGWVEGQNVQKELGIEKWEDEGTLQLEKPGQSNKRRTAWENFIVLCCKYWFLRWLVGPAKWLNPKKDLSRYLPEYTDIEGYRKHTNLLQDGEEVVCCEKLHGSNGAFVCARVGVLRKKTFILRSHHQVRKLGDGSIWDKVAQQYDLPNKMKQYPGLAVYGEIVGNVQKGFDYGFGGKYALKVFDVLDTKTGKYLNYQAASVIIAGLGLERVPELYKGYWGKEVLTLANGKTTVENAKHIREGFVVKPLVERNARIGRVILKVIGEEYLLNKK